MIYGDKMLKIKIEEIKGFTPVNTTKIENAGKKLEMIVNSELFRVQFMAADFSGETSKFKDWDRTDLYNYLMDGSEVLDPNEDNEANMTVTAYRSFKSVIGYTYGNIKGFYLNTRFMYREEKLIASTMLHEYGHKKGFDHDFRRTYRRQFSICYQMNLIVESCYDHINRTKITPKVIIKKSRFQRFIYFIKNLF